VLQVGERGIEEEEEDCPLTSIQKENKSALNSGMLCERIKVYKTLILRNVCTYNLRVNVFCSLKT
jgi:hypothetical protein